jgi:single-strand DNA-binding protein|tara:strand:+ start:674 stop:1036 length:363 start_codon:yes stop_codon:yes gene_type:complete
MASVNKVILVGHVGKEPEIRETKAGDTVATFSLATNSGYGDKKTTDWHRIVFFGKTADVVRDYVTKGKQLYVEGRISNRSYDDKSGIKRYVTEITGYSMQMLGGNGSDHAEVEEKQDIPF